MENILAMISEKPWILVGLLLWMVPWKGWALWRAARRGHIGWFAVLLIVNTLAFLEILYIFIFSRTKTKKEEPLVESQAKTKTAHNLHQPKLII